MKITNYIYLAAMALLFASCEIDNYEEPESYFTGRIVYNGEPIELGVRDVRFQLFQPGFGNLAPLAFRRGAPSTDLIHWLISR